MTLSPSARAGDKPGNCCVPDVPLGPLHSLVGKALYSSYSQDNGLNVILAICTEQRRRIRRACSSQALSAGDLLHFPDKRPRSRHVWNSYKGVISSITAVANDSLTILIPKDCDVVGPMTAHFDDKCFTISIKHITREWHLGDSVQGNQKNSFEHKFGEPDTRMLQVYLAAPSDINPPMAAKQEYMKGGCTQLEAQCALMHTGRGWYQGTDVGVVGHVGWLMEGTQKVGGTRCPLHAGLRGVVVADCDSPARAARLKSIRHRTALPLRDDQQGILVTIGEHAVRHTNYTSAIPFKKGTKTSLCTLISHAAATPLHSDNTTLWGGTPQHDMPPPPLPSSSLLPHPLPPLPAPADAAIVPTGPVHQRDGEETGQWISMPELAMKRIDVQVVGVLKLPKASPKVAGFKGNQRKINVLGIGPGGMKHAIPRNCIKPWHEGDGGKQFWEIAEQVIVLGPDMNSDLGRRGQYAETIPYLPHVHGFGVIGVKFPDGGECAYFHLSSLVLAENIRLQSPDSIFDVTNF
ncbi:hypothetical protein K438DRAFT_1746700 [Mycena galopus ATCC 62051]|nr:hypothetical protein K438DRAFT_1746700 [Mycena galopus ATCC 62051]